MHHKFRVHVDPVQAGVALSSKAFRDVVLRALRAEGAEVVQWQSAPLPAQGVFRRRDPADGFPRTEGHGTDLAANYDPARYPRTEALFAGSVVLFSQSCPLIAQPDDVVDRYIEAFRRVWHYRDLLADWAEHNAS